VAVAAGLLAGCTAASASAANGPPLKAYAAIQPAVHLFGDTIEARLVVVADPKRVDPARLRVSATFAPYAPVAPPQSVGVRAGGVEQLTWTWRLRCLSAGCLPAGPPSEKPRVFRFPQAQVSSLQPDGKPDLRVEAVWPRVEVVSALNPGVAHDLSAKEKFDWRYSVAPVAAPDFRIRPGLLFALAMAAAAVLLAGAFAAAASWYLAIRPRRGAAPAGTPLARALSLLTWAHTHGNETLQRKAFERVAGELGTVRTKNGLSQTATELAWRPELPDEAEVQSFARQAQEVESESSE
jgi:hypothetical protein